MGWFHRRNLSHGELFLSNPHLRLLPKLCLLGVSQKQSNLRRLKFIRTEITEH